MIYSERELYSWKAFDIRKTFNFKGNVYLLYNPTKCLYIISKSTLQHESVLQFCIQMCGRQLLFNSMHSFIFS